MFWNTVIIPFSFFSPSFWWPWKYFTVAYLIQCQSATFTNNSTIDWDLCICEGTCPVLCTQSVWLQCSWGWIFFLCRPSNALPFSLRCWIHFTRPIYPWWNYFKLVSLLSPHPIVSFQQKMLQSTEKNRNYYFLKSIMNKISLCFCLETLFPYGWIFSVNTEEEVGVAFPLILP